MTKTEFYVIRLRAPGAENFVYYSGAAGWPGASVPFEQAEKFFDPGTWCPVLEQFAKSGDVAFVHPVVKYGEDLCLEEPVAHNLPQPTRELLAARGPRVFIVALADSFPCLRGKVDGCKVTPENFDIDRWVKASRPWSHAERAAAMFVATIWNTHGAKAKRWKFDAVDALSVWDNGNRAAFIAWAKSPVWP